MPDRIELATSGRARCRACRRAIAKGEERFAEAVPNPAAEGESQHYYHLACAAERRPKPFAALLPSLDPPRPELEPLALSAQLTLDNHRLERLGALERAKSARAACRQCREPIEKDAWRVALQPIEEGRLGSWGFVHLTCAGAYAGIKPSLERLVRYSELEPNDREQVASVLQAMPIPEPRPPEQDDAPPPEGDAASA
ncbi:MAG TPA: hypothetical protein VMG12_02005 [Polyangiaceae bacterium]|nr:hypothetical protein [Polyangiaceae bacterium]